MQKVGQMWIPDNDPYFEKMFKQTGDKFQANYLEQALSYVSNFDVAIDVGAHVGSWTRILSSQFKEVHAFEPTQQNWECLIENVKGMNNIQLYNKAVAERAKNVTMKPGTQNSGQWHIDSKNRGGDVSAITIDSLALEKLDFIKIDAEGYEHKVLKGAEETIKRCRPIIHIEENGLHSRYETGEHPATDFILSLGYKCVLKNRWDWTFSFDK